MVPQDTITTADYELACYRRMLKIRRFEEKVGLMSALGQVACDCALSVGQEAFDFGLVSAAADGDMIVTNERCHGLLLARGMPADVLLRTLTATATEPDAVRPPDYDGRAHAVAVALGDAGDVINLATATAKTVAQNNNAALVIAVVNGSTVPSDAALDQVNAIVSEKRPIVFVIENNTSPITEPGGLNAIPMSPLSAALNFHIEVATADGVDAKKTRLALSDIFESARTSGEPRAVEVRSFAYTPHGSPAARAGNAALARERTDPIEMVRARLIRTEDATETELKELEKSVRGDVNAAVSRART